MYYNLYGEVSLKYSEKKVDESFYAILDEIGIANDHTFNEAMFGIGNYLDEETWEYVGHHLIVSIYDEDIFDRFMDLLVKTCMYCKDLVAEFSGNEAGDPKVQHWRYVLAPDGTVEEQTGKVVYIPYRQTILPDYKIRCANCACLVAKGGKWFCDEAGQYCEKISDCPEEVPVLAKFVSKMTNETSAEHIGELVEIVQKKEYPNESRYTIKFSDGTIAENVYPTELEIVLSRMEKSGMIDRD